jgi:LacI family transcriptional regulator
MSASTIKDVARAAQVSVATVSRVLNGHHNVTAEVKRRVVEAAGVLKYVPHAAARSLSSRRTHTVGVVLPDLHGEFFSELVRGSDAAAREHGLHLLVSSYHGYPEEQGKALHTLRGRVDGLLVMWPFADAPESLRDRLTAALPTVLINSAAMPGGDVLSVDNCGGAMQMMRHLVSAGHRRIAFIAGPEGNFDAHERLRGYHEALAELLPGSEPWVVPGVFDEASGHRAGQALLAAAQRPDAVFAANDMMAVGCLFAFSQSGLRVPDDIALAGFDDIPLARYMHPSLTTMRVNIARLGELAAHALVARLADDSRATQSRVISPELIVRGSSGPRAADDRRDSS